MIPCSRRAVQRGPFVLQSLGEETAAVAELSLPAWHAYDAFVGGLAQPARLSPSDASEITRPTEQLQMEMC
eukprot:Skav203130  [mRNA]  locus=scaffold3040:169332:171310:+ [translate_table: standard]